MTPIRKGPRSRATQFRRHAIIRCPKKGCLGTVCESYRRMLQIQSFKPVEKIRGDTMTSFGRLVG
jgi:hypothetical protein